MTKDNTKKYQKEVQEMMFKEVDILFPKNKSKERDKALLLVAILGVKFKSILKEIISEDKKIKVW